jgi:sulfane dehydrogenase subunit SoxC
MKELNSDINKRVRRRALLGGLATAAATLFTNSHGQTIQRLSTIADLPPDPSKVPGVPPGGVGTRSTFETLAKVSSDTSSRTPLQDLFGSITPSDLHYERHHAGVPAIDPHRYELLVHSLVERSMVFTLDDLKRFPSVTRICFIECSGNFRGSKEKSTPQEVLGLTSQSEWTGVMLSTIFREVGLKRGATWFLAEGGDAALLTRSVPVKKGLEDAMLVYAQNGEAIRPEQGYPVRLLLPGWEGNTNVKWLRRIEVGDAPYMTREETARYTYPVKDRIRQFSFEMDARSIITYPSYPKTVQKGWIEIRGIAWSGWGKIDKVEVSTDGGKSWQIAILQGPILPKAHTVFRHLWNWDGRTTEILSRATDETGYTQPTLKQLLDARGKDMTGYHLNPVTSWVINSDGTVLFKPEKWK